MNTVDNQILEFIQLQGKLLFQVGAWFVIFMIVFYVCSIVFPGKRKQPFIRHDMTADSLYWFLGPALYGAIFLYIIKIFYSNDIIRYFHSFGTRHFSVLHVMIQAFLILLITDFIQYWVHRLFHHHPFWNFHAIHHSSKHLDWLSSARFHPVNIIVYSTAVNALVATLGFAPEAFVLLAPFNMVYSPLVHANLDWNYGPFRYFLASPIYHRWHHTTVEEGGNKNFAPTFPFIDLMFGTYYMPKGVIPTNFGIEGDPVPDHFHGQMLYPFKRAKSPEKESDAVIAHTKA